MVEAPPVLVLATMGGLISLAALFSGSETAFFSLGPVERRRIALKHGVAPRLATACLASPHALLVTLLLSNLAAHVFYFALASTLASRIAGGSGWLAALFGVAALLLLVMLGEIVPKVVAIASAERIALWVAPLCWGLRLALLPVRLPIEWILTRLLRHGSTGTPHAHLLAPDELQELLSIQPDRFELNRRAAAMLREVISLSDVKVREVMTPRVDLVAIDVETPLSRVREFFRARKLAWVPVYRGNLDGVLGLLDARDVFLSGGTEVRSLIKNLPAVPEVARLDHLVRSFRESGTTHALVVDEYGGTAGIVTLEQVVWEILGDLFRASEGDSVVKRVGDGAFHVDGSLPIREWNELFEDSIPSDRFETIGGYVVSLLNRLPREDDASEDDSFRYRVLKVKGRRVRQLEVTERT